MRQTGKNEYIGQVTFDLIKRIHDANRHIPGVRETNALFVQGLEALMYHPLKDDLFVFAQFNEESQRCKSLSVWDYGSNISNWSIHEPEGDTRSKRQLQISYLKDVQKKRPRNIKRSCNPKVIKQMVSEIETCKLDSIVTGLDAHVDRLVDAVPEVHKYIGCVNTFFREIYCMHTDKQAAVLRSMLTGEGGEDWSKPHEGFQGSILDAGRFFLDKYTEAIAIKKSYKKHRVAMFSSPMGKYKVVRHIVTDGRQDVLVDIYPSKETLPADVLGNLSVLDIAESASQDRDSEIRVPGIGCVTGELRNEFYLVGENFVDPRVESQSQGSQTS